jgi:aldose 1-epimerase
MSTVENWGAFDGQPVYRYRLQGEDGLACLVSNYGVTITHLWAPDREGNVADVVLGFDTLNEYIEKSMYFGCAIGRYGNRIGGGRFHLDGFDYTLETNNEPGGVPCHLHGGLRGFDKVVWKSEPMMNGVLFRYASYDEEEGYPGNLDCRLLVSMTGRTLRLEYEAVTDRPTVINLTNHSYFNLRGAGEGDILDHHLTLDASSMTPTDAGMIPTGEIRAVAGTPFDFTSPHLIGQRIGAADEQLAFGGGYDHNWVVDGEGFRRAAVLEAAGRVMETWSDQPGIQFYCGNFLDGRTGKEGRSYEYRGGLCLETQHFPDSPNKQGFPSTVLRPGEVYRTATEYRFR